jgi:AmmeMemoRadiSam system protein A
VLPEEDRRALLDLARRAVDAAVRGADPPSAPSSLRGALREKGAAFVTLRAGGRLRGCVGHVQAVAPLWESVRDMARAAAEQDGRFEPIRPEELADLEIEISILSPMSPIRPENVVPGLHGLYVRRGSRAGLLLPQVAAERGWGREEFVRRAFEKAGLPPGDPGAELYAFTAERFAAG